jgi:hypothetical protein
MKRVISLTALVLILTAAGFADIARPDNSPKAGNKKSIETTMMIHLKHDAKEAVLVIPKNQIKQLRAQLDALDEGTDTASVTATGGVTRTQTIVSGSFLSLALVFGGIWFIRSGKNATKAGKTLAILMILACVGSAATFVFGNAGPPPEARSITGKMFSQAVHIYGFGSGAIKLQTSTGDQDYIDLIVPDPQTTPSGEE